MDQILGLQTSGGVSDLGQRVAVISLGAPFGPSFGPPFGASHDGTERVRSTMISYLIHYPCRSVVFRDVVGYGVSWCVGDVRVLSKTGPEVVPFMDPFMDYLSRVGTHDHYFGVRIWELWTTVLVDPILADHYGDGLSCCMLSITSRPLLCTVMVG